MQRGPSTVVDARLSLHTVDCFPPLLAITNHVSPEIKSVLRERWILFCAAEISVYYEYVQHVPDVPSPVEPNFASLFRLPINLK